ncbi:MAG: glycoside hydrolase family 88 protein [Tannerella sp.]|jgi:rhamnogalacturonyl hydrolase YesR|nr:glycoside hydrolase family 88 protein [Tannerella sp.]
MKNSLLYVWCTLHLLLNTGTAVSSDSLREQPFREQPVETVKRIADKLIRETPFAYRLILPKAKPLFNDLMFVDFGRTFGTGKRAVAYAYTQLTFHRDTLFPVYIEHNDGCKVWCNGRPVYEKGGKRNIDITRGERNMEMSSMFVLPLKKGDNDILIKSELQGDEWCVFLQPPGEKGAVLKVAREYPAIGLRNVKYVDAKVADLTPWLVTGPFAPGIDTVREPETEFRFGRMYQGLERPVTWTVPRIEVLGDVIGAVEWGATYQWNYHNGGVAWAMQLLGELTEEEKYTQWGNNFCDYQMEGIPFVDYQVNELRAYHSANSPVTGSTLLDFTLAPSLPLVYRLRKESNFKNRDIYEKYIGGMMEYAMHGQIRTEGMRNYTRNTPEEFTVWTDDMFMGIPFLMQAAQYTASEELRKAFYDDAAQQVLDFGKHVWNDDAQLYMHAGYTSRPEVKLPHWSRANGWAIWAMSDVLMALPRSHPGYKNVLRQYRRFVNSLVRYQDQEGFWHNVIDCVDSPAEVSGTAIFTMAMARGIRYGWLERKKFMPVVMKGWHAIASEIEDDGTVHKICVGTMCSEDIDHYMNRPFYDNDTHGSFAVIFAGIEMQQIFDKF